MTSPASLRRELRQFLPDDPTRVQRIGEVLGAAGIGLAVVHGSRVRGGARQDSDLDVALLAADARPISYATMGSLALDLSDALSAEVDVSDLSTPDAVFRYEVAGCARLLFQDRPEAFTDFVAKAMIDYSDIQRFLPELVAGVARGRRRISKVDLPSEGKRTVSGEVLARKIAAICARTARVRELLPPALEEFLAKRTQAEALILNLFLALQECSDLALHLAAELGLGVPGEPRAAFEALARNEVLPPSLARALSAAVGLRNRIAHEYGGLDLGKVYVAARDDLGDLDAYADAIAEARLALPGN